MGDQTRKAVNDEQLSWANPITVPRRCAKSGSPSIGREHRENVGRIFACAASVQAKRSEFPRSTVLQSVKLESKRSYSLPTRRS